MDITITGAGGIDANLAPDAFRRWAIHYYQCKQDFRSPHAFSPVPYFLLCRAIELAIKSRHLHTKTQAQVKKDYDHNLKRAYDTLPARHKTLTPDEVQLLTRANRIYGPKGFEYFDPEDALSGYSRYPDLEALDSLATKLIEGAA